MRLRVVSIFNDSSNVDLKFKFKESEAWSTLHPKETVQFEFWTRDIYLLGVPSCPYRVWGIG